MSQLVRPIVALEMITRSKANQALERWSHRVGPNDRPPTIADQMSAHGLFHGEELVAVATTDCLMATSVCGIARDDAIELSRLCAAERYWCRVMLRLWRLAVFPAFRKAWAISYQNEAWHNGDLYRFDGWKRLGRSHSGPDRRTGRSGYSKTIWGWSDSSDAVTVAFPPTSAS